MKLFDEIRQPSVRCQRRTESTMEYLNSVTLSAYEETRSKLEALFCDYPLQEEQKRQFKGRLWGGDASAEGAFYEMFMAGALSRLGRDGQVKAEYPLDGKPVDLRVSHPGGDFYVECKTRLTSKNQYGRPYPHLYELLDALDEDKELAESPFVGLVFARHLGNNAPSKRRFLNSVKERLPELWTVAESIKSGNASSAEELCEPVAYKPRERGEVEVHFYWRGNKGPRRFVVLNSLGGGVVEDETPFIQGALEEKASQHRKPDLPYIIAINWCYPASFETPGRWRGGGPEIEAVYGRGHFDVMDNSEPYEVKSEVKHRKVNCWLEQVFSEGLFVDRQGEPQHRHVSGVLFTRRATPLLDNLSWKFFGNPFATYPAPQMFKQIPNVWPHLCEWSHSYTGSTTLHVSADWLPWFPDGFQAGAHPLFASATFNYQGFLQSAVTGKVGLHDLLGIDYPEPDEFGRLIEDAEREAMT